MNEYVPGLEGVPATKSNISSIDGDKGILSYRGYPIEVLAERSTFEETALLLLDGNLPTRTTRHNGEAVEGRAFTLCSRVREVTRVGAAARQE